MKIEIDFKAIKDWFVGHMNWVVPVGLIFLSWFGANTALAVKDDMKPWWIIFSLCSGFGGLGLAARFFVILFGIE